MKLKDKVALVTSTSPNIGGGIAEDPAAEGAGLVCVDASSASTTDRTKYVTRHKKRIRHRGGPLAAIVPGCSTS